METVTPEVKVAREDIRDLIPHRIYALYRPTIIVQPIPSPLAGEAEFVLMDAVVDSLASQWS